MKRMNVSVEQLRILIRIGAFRFTKRTKKELLWDIHTIIGSKNKTIVTKELFEVAKSNFVFPTLDYNSMDDAFDVREILGFTLKSPFTFLKNPMTSSFTAADFQLNKGSNVEIAGNLVTTKHTRTKHNDRMMFGTFIDINGKIFDTTHFPKICNDFPIRGKGCYMIKGKVAEEFGFFSLDVISLKFLENFTLD